MAQRFSTQLFTQVTSDVKDLQTKAELNQVYNALRNLALQLDAYTGALSPVKSEWGIQDFGTILGANAFKIYVQATVAIPYGAAVNFYNSGGLRARLASAASPTTRASAFCSISTGVNSGDFGEFICGPGVISGILGMTPGTSYYLSDTPGVLSAAPGTNPQRLGIALDASTFLVQSFNGYL
jgi:type II secretory pathway pseudopilin PulG